MDSKLLLIFLVSAVVMVVQSTAFDGANWGRLTDLGVEEEMHGGKKMMMKSSSGRRQLEGAAIISYAALSADTVPCSNRGTSYYNCETGAKNPYNRGCSSIADCS